MKLAGDMKIYYYLFFSLIRAYRLNVHPRIPFTCYKKINSYQRIRNFKKIENIIVFFFLVYLGKKFCYIIYMLTIDNLI